MEGGLGADSRVDKEELDGLVDEVQDKNASEGAANNLGWHPGMPRLIGPRDAQNFPTFPAWAPPDQGTALATLCNLHAHTQTCVFLPFSLCYSLISPLPPR